MSDTTRLNAEVRTEFGKGFARRARKAGKVPAVLYGHGEAPRHLSFDSIEFARAIKGGANTILTLDLEGGEELALPKSVVRHPIKDYFEHVDLLIVKRGEKVTVDVQVHIIGDAAPGSLVITDLSTVSVEVDALAIPEYFEMDITDSPIGTQLLANQIPLPDGVTLLTDAEALVVAIQHAPTADQLEAEDAEGAAELGIEQDQPESEAGAAAEGEKSEGNEG